MRALLAIMLLLTPLPAFALVVEADTAWQGRMTVHEAVRVEPDATLTVRPGAEIVFDGGRLEVAGTLVAEEALFTGRDWAGISLKGVDGATVLKRCRIVGAQTGIFVGSGAPRLIGVELVGNRVGVELKQKSAAEITGCLFQGNSRVGLFVKDESTPVVSGNRFEKNGRFGAYIYRAVPQSFVENSFEGNATGLAVTHFGSDPTIENNDFVDNEEGILVDRAARPQLIGNRLRGNKVGLKLHRRSDAGVRGNRLLENGIGILVSYSSYPRIANNDLAGNDLALKLEFQSSRWEREKGSEAREQETAARGAFGQPPKRAVSEEERRAHDLSGTVDARDNWWGEDGTAELARIGTEGNPSFIADGRDTPNFVETGQSYPMDRVRFAPWCKAPCTVAGKATDKEKGH